MTGALAAIEKFLGDRLTNRTLYAIRPPYSSMIQGEITTVTLGSTLCFRIGVSATYDVLSPPGNFERTRLRLAPPCTPNLL